MAHGMEAIDEEPGPLKEFRASIEHVFSLLAVEVVHYVELIQNLLRHPLVENLEQVFSTLRSHHAVPAITHCMQAAANKKASSVFLGVVSPLLLLETEELCFCLVFHWIVPFSDLLCLWRSIHLFKARKHSNTYRIRGKLHFMPVSRL